MTDKERELIAHLFEVLFDQMGRAGALTANVCVQCVRNELEDFAKGIEDDE